jgi:hypothetical protein
MAGKNKQPQQEEESGEGAPLWIISFADMISLLMAFFVMLTTFSGFGPKESAKLRKVINATLAPNFYGGWFKNLPRGAMGHQMVSAGQAEKGSEKPTLEESAGGGSLAESEPTDFRSQNVFLIESEKTFWGGGTTLSTQGRDFLNCLSVHFSRIPGRIAVSEVGPGENRDIGILRAAAVVEYLGSKGIPKSRCSIGTRAALPETNLKAMRTLEIILLE